MSYRSNYVVDHWGQKQTTGHEIGHAIGMTGDYLAGDRLTTMVWGFEDWATEQWTNIPEGYDSIDTNEIRMK